MTFNNIRESLSIYRILTILLISLLPYSFADAQIVKDIETFLKDDTTTHTTKEEKNAAGTAENETDSVKLIKVRKELEEAKINEANLKLQLELSKYQHDLKDSLKRAELKHKIDSLRNITKGVPVVVKDDTLFTIYAKWGGYTATERAEGIIQKIESLGKNITLKPDSVYIENTDLSTEIMYKNKVIASVTDMDALWEGMSREKLAQKWDEAIVKELVVLHKEHNILQILKRILFFLLVICGQVGIIWLLAIIYRKLKKKIILLKSSKLKPIKFHDYELLNIDRQVKIITWFTNIGRYVLIAIILIITVPILFSIFPQTENIALKLFAFIWNPIKKVLHSIVAYIPNLFMIVVIYLAMHYLIRGVGYITREIEAERLKISGFYSDWAQPTYHIVRFLLYAFMIAMIYPYLPGSDSRVFQGISVFVGLIVSLGSSSVISNIMAGLVITYMRPFKIGDRIQLNETMGNVMEKTPFVTRIKTIKNEIVTIPNSFVMSSHTINFSASARHFGLIIHTEVTIGYDVPWRKVHQLLIDSAKATEGVQSDPEPFVLETALNDWYPVYQINAYIQDVDKTSKIMSDMIQNIQDQFAKADVEILSPQYIATRDGNESTVPKS